MKRLLFVCVHNAGRSQMAAAFAQQLSQGKVLAESAGTMPADQVNPVVVAVMQERGLDLSLARPKLLTPQLVQQADRVISMGCAVAEACPAVFVPVEDWGLPDPAGKPLEEVRRIRDEIEHRVRTLLAELDVS
jgi:arsenate reductase